eukprot:GFYU01001648.1.p2 GENE.GFYU01001648.1~~GFYU01001648.1.p2  ORF type:complete len:116 (-),score=30.87 GFYU01001648.1:421-768(-)
MGYSADRPPRPEMVNKLTGGKLELRRRPMSLLLEDEGKLPRDLMLIQKQLEFQPSPPRSCGQRVLYLHAESDAAGDELTTPPPPPRLNRRVCGGNKLRTASAQDVFSGSTALKGL